MADVECRGAVEALREALSEWAYVVESWRALQALGERSEAPWVDVARAYSYRLFAALEEVEKRLLTEGRS